MLILSEEGLFWSELPSLANATFKKDNCLTSLPFQPASAAVRNTLTNIALSFC